MDDAGLADAIKMVGWRMHEIITSMIALTAAGTSATAQDAVPQLDAVLKCRIEVAREARLACFDRSVAALDRAQGDKTVLILDRSAVVERKQRQFGLASRRGETFGGGEADRQTAVVDLNTTIQHVSPSTGMPGRWNLALANGMVWQTIESIARTPAPGTIITLRRALLGGYRATIGHHNRAVPVKRLR